MSARDLLERPSSSPARSIPPGRVWRWRRGRLLAVVATAAVAGGAAGLLTPRGPITGAEAVVTMIVSLVVGAAAGTLLADRWAFAVAPGAYVVVLELVRIGVRGPTVDAPRLTIAGLALWGAVRLLHGLFAIVPMLLGARWGIEVVARRNTRGRALRPSGRIVLWLSTLGVLALGVVAALPGSTAPITGPDGRPVPGSIAELTTVTIDGAEQALMIRGVSQDAPVLLHLAGGPGGTDIGAMRLDTGLEAHFVVVTWDQRGTGKSYRALDPTETLTLESTVADTLAVTDHLCDRFGQNRIFLTGQSWGTLPAVLAVQRHPERYHAFVGTGQMVSPTATDRIFYEETLAWARERGDADLEGQLVALGPPPYDRYLDYLTIVGSERAMYAYPEFDGRTEMTSTIRVRENGFMDRLAAVRGLVDTYALLYPQLQDLDLRETVPRLEVPVHLVMGEHEARGRLDPAREWFDALEAPAKEWVELPASSHRASFEQPAAYTELLVRVRDAAMDVASG